MDLSQKPDENPTPHDGTGEGPRYAYRPSPLGGGYAFRLTGEGIAYETGRRPGLVPYSAVTRVRMSFKPANMQSYRFVTEIWASDAPKLTIASATWTGIMVQERQDKPYTAFIAELHRRLVAAAAPIAYERGTPSLKYWPGIVAFVAVALSMAALIVRALQGASLPGALFIAAFLALFLWYGGNYFRRNKPGVYTPDALPADLVP